MSKQSTKPISDETIAAIIDSKIRQSTTWYSSNDLSTTRERVKAYYDQQFPKRLHDGSSSYVSSDVYDGVETLRAKLLETFAVGRDIVRFDPRGPDDIDDSMVATKYTDYVVFGQNDGYGIFSDVIFDALMSRVGVVKVWWEVCEDYETESFEGIPEEAVLGLAAMDDIDDLDATQDISGLFSGTLTRKIDHSKVSIEVIPPEEFSIEPQAKGLSKDTFCVHSTLKRIDDLLRMGYDRKQLENIGSSADPDELTQRPEVLQRFRQVDYGNFGKADNQTEQFETKWVLVHEAYNKFKRKGDKYAKLYKVVRCGSETLDIEEVDSLPFVAFVPLPISHSFYGNNFAERLIPYQRIQTGLVRSVVDHVAVTNNPRYQVVKGGLTNPRELLDNRLGGLVNTTRPDAIVPIPQAPMNPYVYQTIELLNGRKEEMTGISRLSQGLDKNAISSQNSQGLVNDLVSLSETRHKVIARNFARQFLIPLYLKVYDLVLKNETKESLMEVAGGFQSIDPKRWSERKTATTSLHLGYGEMERQAQMYGQMGATWANDPVLNTMFTAKNRYSMATDVAKMVGIDNVEKYLTPPEQIPPPEPDPIAIQQIKNETMKAEATMVSAQASQAKVEAHIAIEELRQKLDVLQKQFDNEMKTRESDRLDMKTVNDIDIAEREMTIAEDAQFNSENERIIVSPS